MAAQQLQWNAVMPTATYADETARADVLAQAREQLDEFAAGDGLTLTDAQVKQTISESDNLVTVTLYVDLGS